MCATHAHGSAPARRCHGDQSSSQQCARQRPHDTATDAVRNCCDGPMARAHAGSPRLQEAEACLPRCGLHGPPDVWSTDPAATATTERTTASGPTIVDKQPPRIRTRHPHATAEPGRNSVYSKGTTGLPEASRCPRIFRHNHEGERRADRCVFPGQPLCHLQRDADCPRFHRRHPRDLHSSPEQMLQDARTSAPCRWQLRPCPD